MDITDLLFYSTCLQHFGSTLHVQTFTDQSLGIPNICKDNVIHGFSLQMLKDFRNLKSTVTLHAPFFL